MSYQALYRVWRPQRFADVVGQQVITQTLKNAIITNQISHAYLFAGPRGTGKTSAAKIFAKAINCHHQKDGEPCNECEICQSITAGTLNDVIEIDAASNNGVEEIRDIRDKAKYAPTQADYKVYIIDEVHMLSTGAFNALLKTLEEPPANVIFILATTEPHKIPLTILSRVQRFDFHRISPQDTFDRMKYILDQKKFKYEEKALWVIANAAEGGMRDALSILDQALSFGDDDVTLDDALLVTGSVTKKLLQTYFQQVATHEGPAALKTMDQILGQGKDGQRFIEDLISFIRDLLLYQESPELIEIAATGLKEADFQELSQLANAQQLYQMIDVLNQVQDEMRFTTHPDVYLEVLTIRLSQISSEQPSITGTADQQEIDQLKQQVQSLQQMVQKLSKQAPPVNQSRVQPKKTAPTGQPVRINLEQVYQILDHATKQDLVDLQNMWPDILNLLNPAYRSLIELSKPVAASPDGVVVAFDNGFLLQKASVGNLADDVNQGLEKITGSERHVAFVPSGKWPQIRHDFLADRGYFKKQSTTQVKDPVKTSQQKQHDQITSQAEKFFGTGDVEIKND
ncbi:DNA polymerase III, subunit gamma and tau [Limosilactobacillus coleohominis 101-4-CHN]|uniref:DNA-directed DNA polymerase n=1 Tax=Limosilactobacillus coleohominis 101-4-CHN TaxID=575594 RepID=C7XWB3_9LACO|nr:DNA polymerase III subunit gamma/tau [Limosilactobacillus coleohominis]EEU30173.1 DNA polymerase III, subunit gamma and tau [Limosilactobacillus coleohominis 101-4-CHN]